MFGRVQDGPRCGPEGMRRDLELLEQELLEDTEYQNDYPYEEAKKDIGHGDAHTYRQKVCH